MSFTTPDSVKLFLSRETLDPMQTLQIAQLILEVDAIITNYCGWSMLSADYTAEEFDGNGAIELDLGVYPLNEVTKVMVAGEDVTSLIKVSKKDGSILYADGSTTFPVGRLNVAVDFSAGYTPDTVPKDLEYAANYLVTVNMNQIEDGTLGLKSDKLEDTITEFNYTDLPKLVTRVLDRYRRLGIA